MKRYSITSTILLAGALLLAAPGALAQSANVMAYQGYLTDTDGNPLAGPVNMTFKLYAAASSGSALWTETQTNVALADGIFSVMLGSVATLDGVSFDGPRYLGVSVNGGTELSPRVALGAAPASFYARDIAAGVAVRSINGLSDDVVIEAGDNVTISEADGVLTIDAEAGAQPFALPFEGSNDTNEVAFKVTSSVAGGIVADAEGSGAAISASTSGTGNAAGFANINSVGTGVAIDAFSFSSGGTGVFSHFGTVGYAGLFRSTNPSNTWPALVARKQDLSLDAGGFSNDALIVEGDKPVIGVYSKFQGDTRPGLVLAGVDGSNVVDKWGIVREFFANNSLHFTYGLNADHEQNTSKMILSSQGNLQIPQGFVTARQLRADDELGATSTPAAGTVYKDNVVYAWAQVLPNGTATASYGCTVSKITGTGSYRVTFKRQLPNGVSAVVTVQTVNDPVIATAAANAARADVATKVFNGTTFVAADYGFYIQVVGRP